MTAHQDSTDLSMLSWCAGEIRQALDVADENLSRQLTGDGGDLSLLAVARGSLHQAHGALGMVDLPGTTQLTGEAETLLGRVEEGELEFSADVANKLSAAFTAINEYLDELLRGDAQQPLRLYPYLKDLLELRKADRVHPADLFFPELVRLPVPDTPPVELNTEELGAIRSQFETGLLGALRSSGDTTKLAQMAGAVRRLQASSLSSANHSFWMVANGFFSALEKQQLELDAYGKRLLARINLQIRRTLQGGSPVADRLLRDTLFSIARGDPEASELSEIFAAFGLAGLVPTDFEKPRYRSFDRKALASANDALSTMKKTWESMLSQPGGVAEHLGQYKQALSHFRDAADELDVDGLDKLVAAWLGVVKALGADSGPVSDAVGVEVATSILFMEQLITFGLKDFEDLPGRAGEMAHRIDETMQGQVVRDEAPRWLQELTSAVQERLTVSAFTAETQSALRETESILDNYFRDPEQGRDNLPTAQKNLGQIAGVLKLLGHEDAASAAGYLATQTGEMVDGGRLDPQILPVMAGSVGTLGFFLDAVKSNSGLLGTFVFDPATGIFEQRVLHKEARADMSRSVSTVDASVESATAGSPAEAQEPVQESAESVLERHLLGLDTALCAWAESSQDAALGLTVAELLQNVCDGAQVIEATELLEKAQACLDVAGRAGPDAAIEIAGKLGRPSSLCDQSVPIAETPVLPEAEEDVDEELLEIFLAEAVEVLETIGASQGQLQQAPTDQMTMTTVRRGFHTLKGSSRMVGLDSFGEAAWSLEQVLNTWLAEEKRADDDLLRLIGQAGEVFSQWVASLEPGSTRTPRPDPALMVARAEAIRAGQSFDSVAEPARPEAPAVPGANLVQAPTEPVAIDTQPMPEPEREEAFALPETFEAVADAVDANGLTGNMDAGSNEPAAGFVPQIEALADTPDVSDATPVSEPGHAADPGGANAFDGGDSAGFASFDDVKLPVVNFDSDFAFPAASDPVDAEALETEAFTEDPGAGDPAAYETQIEEIEAIVPQFDEPESIGFELSGDATEFESDSALVSATRSDDPDALGFELVAEADDSGESLDGLSVVEIDGSGEVDEVIEAVDAVDPVDEISPIEAVEAIDEPAPETTEAAAEPAAVTDDIVTVGNIEISRPLFDVFCEETRQLRKILVPDAQAWVEEPTRNASELARRAMHSLKGSAALVQVEPVRALSGSLEQFLAIQISSARQASGQDIATYQHLVDVIFAALADFTECRTPADCSQDIVAAGKLHAAWQEAVRQGCAASESKPAAVATPEASEDGVPTIQDEFDEELLPLFVEEAEEYLPQIDENLRAWLKSPGDTKLQQLIMRQFHTVKGSARMAGAMVLGQRVHDMETQVEAAMSMDDVPVSLIEELLAEQDIVSEQFEYIRDPSLKPREPAPLATETPVAAAGVPSAPESGAVATDPAAAVQDAHRLHHANPLVRVRSELLDKLVNEAGEVSIARSRLDNSIGGLRLAMNELGENVNRLRAHVRELEMQGEMRIQASSGNASEASADFDPLEFDRFTRFQELTRMMAESVNDVGAVQGNATRAIDEAMTDLNRQGQNVRQLQHNLMGIRMVQFGTVSDRLYRVVRQVAKQLGKRVSLDIRGVTVQMDRGVLEKMVAPLEHLLRNAVSHGIEAPDVRVAAGKSETGDIRLEVVQDGNETMIVLSDDGGGLDLAKIRDRAVERGLIESGARTSDARLADMIFMPGFSTARKVDQISGRGVGMDVVRSEVSLLGGRVQVSFESTKGTRFMVHLPLTMAIEQVMMVSVGERRYAVPSASVEQVLQFDPERLARAYAERSVLWQDEQIPLYNCGSLVQVDQQQITAQHVSPVIVLKSAGRRIAVHADEVSKSQEVVVKNVGVQVAKVVGIAGATLMGNGEVVLILHLGQLAEQLTDSEQEAAMRAGMAAGLAEAPATVMVVDDSVTVRKVTQRFLSREGFDVILAKDGVDALRQLEERLPDVMLVDVEMPRMDGFDLTRALRKSPRLKHLPVVMITSRTADKHRNFAMSLGVNEYLGKPYDETRLLELINTYVARLRENQKAAPVH